MEFADITEEFGNAYKAFLKRYKNFGPSQMNKCLCWLSKLVYLAVDYEILRANPLEDMEYEKKPAPKHRHISRAELKAILETPMLDPLQELGRRAFLFSTFTGLARYFMYDYKAALDSVSEWYLDRENGYLYYMPCEGEDMNTALCVAPVLHQWVSVKGKYQDPVKNMKFEGLSFQYSSYMIPKDG